MRSTLLFLSLSFVVLFSACSSGGSGNGSANTSKPYYIVLNWEDGSTDTYQGKKPNWSSGSTNGSAESTTNGFRDESSTNVMPVAWIYVYGLNNTLENAGSLNELSGKELEYQIKIDGPQPKSMGKCTIKKVTNMGQQDSFGSGDKYLYKVEGTLGGMTIPRTESDQELKSGKFSIRTYSTKDLK